MTKRAFALVAPPPTSSRAVVESPYFDSKEAMAYLRLKYQQQLHHLIKEHGLPTLRCGGRLRFDKRELDAWLRGTTALELRRAGK